MNKFDKANTPNETIDVVNEEDEVIGESTKDEAGYNPDLIHRAVSILIYNKKGEALVQKRNGKKEVYPGVWAMSCSGHVPKGINPNEAALMELKEELGIETKLTFIRKDFRKYSWETHFTYIYIGEVGNDIKFNFNKFELETAHFMNFETYKNLEKGGERVSKYSDDIFREFYKGKLIPEPVSI